MHVSNHGQIRQQVWFLQRQFLPDGELPFRDILSKEVVLQALTAAEVVWKERIYSPVVTLWIFLGQVLSADHSCRLAVARFNAHRLARGQSKCSSETGAYCQSRKRLSEKFFSIVATLVGRKLDDRAKSDWLWKGRRVYLVDGTTVSMPDTPANQERSIPNTVPRSQVEAFPWHGSLSSFRFPAEQSSTWESAATLAKVKAS